MPPSMGLEQTHSGHDRSPASILSVDVGGSGVKILVTGQSEPRRQASGPQMTPQEMVETVRELAADWNYEAVSIGYPGQVGDHGPKSEPGNLVPGGSGSTFLPHWANRFELSTTPPCKHSAATTVGGCCFSVWGPALGPP